MTFHIDPRGTGTPGLTEEQVQTQCVKMLRMAWPSYVWASNVNERKQSIYAGARTKAAGRLKGREDGTIYGPGGWTAHVEVKRHDGVLSDAQMLWLRWLHDNGFRVAVVRSAESLHERMREWTA